MSIPIDEANRATLGKLRHLVAKLATNASGVHLEAKFATNQTTESRT